MHKRLHAIGMSLLLGMSIGLARAQDETKPKQNSERIVTATNLVTINVIVTDRNGKYVKGLERNQFEVYDEKVKQRIAHFSNEPGPVSLGIVCEIHNSTPKETRAMLTALKQFTHSLRSDDDFFFTAFGAQGSVTAGFVPTADQVLDHLEIVQPGGPSSFYDAIFTAAERLRRGRHLKKALIIVSDGDDDKSRTSYDQLRDRLKEFDVQIYAIGISNTASERHAGHSRWHFEDITRQTRRRFLLNDKVSIGRAVLAELARVSGGASYFPESENESELLWICAQIALELRQQYTLGFYPTEQIEKKSWRRIQVKVKTGRESRGLVLSYRRGYRPINRQVGYLPISLSPL